MLREYTSPTNSTLSSILKKHLSSVADEFHWHTEQIEDIQQDLKNTLTVINFVSTSLAFLVSELLMQLQFIVQLVTVLSLQARDNSPFG